MELIDLANVRQALEEYGNEVRNKYQDNLILNDRIAGGDLLNSVEYRVNQDGQEYEVTLSLKDYWKYIEYGTKPHFPPVDKILGWIKVKPVIPRPLSDGSLPTPEGLAWMIAKKIAKYGTEGSHDLEEAIEDVNARYKDKLIVALHQDMETIMKVIVGDFQGSIMR